MRISPSVLSALTKRTRPSFPVWRNTPCPAEPKESLAGLAFLPIAATAGYYLLSPDKQAQPAYQLAPQITAYVCLGVWLFSNQNAVQKFGLHISKLPRGIQWGVLTGLLLGAFNTAMILHVTPALGWDIEFLRNTPHAQIPPAVMVPWLILCIAMGVELNFRGFLLGRLSAVLAEGMPSSHPFHLFGMILALGVTALAFAFDPFLVSTFRHLHWIAVWDGLIWGWIWLQTRNLYTVIIAHSMEVSVEYLVIRSALL